jgi:hypothetical protein
MENVCESKIFKISLIDDSEIHREWLKTELSYPLNKSHLQN